MKFAQHIVYDVVQVVFCSIEHSKMLTGALSHTTMQTQKAAQNWVIGRRTHTQKVCVGGGGDLKNSSSFCSFIRKNNGLGQRSASKKHSMYNTNPKRKGIITGTGVVFLLITSSLADQ